MSQRRRSQARSALLFASPWLVGFGVFLVYPLLASLYYSFCDYSVLKEPVWIGGANYRELWADELFWKTLVNTATYAAIALPLGMIVAVSLAMLLNSNVRGLAFYRTIFFLPSLVPMVSLAVLWLWMFNSEHGLVNQTLRWAGLPAPNWLTDPNVSKLALVLMSVWGVGNAMIIVLAGLQDVPQSLYEAAELDGANALKKK